MIEIELIVVFILIAIALAANFFMKRKRAARKARQEHELGIQESPPEQKVQQQPLADTQPQIKPAVKAAPIESVAQTPKKEKKVGCHIPQDSMLKRHFLNHQRSLIESQHTPRPTECVLRRHYDTMIDVELDKQIKAMST